MILFITTKEHEQDLEYLEDLQIRTIPEMQDMQQVFCKELRFLMTVSHIIVDENAVDMKTWESAVQMLQEAKTLPLLLLIKDQSVSNTYIKKDGYEILNQAHQDIRHMVIAWIENQQESLRKTWIAVAGLDHNAGTTAMAMHLSAYIAGCDQDVAYTEYSTASVLQIVADTYRLESIEGGWQKGKIHFYHNQIDEEAGYTVFDLGIIENRILPVWQRCPVKVLVADGKPYRLLKLHEQLKRLSDYPGRIYLVFNFVAEDDQVRLREQYENENIRVWFAPFHPELITYRKEYRDLLKDYVADPKPEKEKRKGHLDIKKLGGIIGSSFLGILITVLSVAAGIKLCRSVVTLRMKPEETIVCEIEYPLSMQPTVSLQDRMPTLEKSTDTEEMMDTEITTEAITTEVRSTEKTTSEQVVENTQKAATQETTEATTETTTAAIPIPMRPSLRGYQGQIYTGSEVIAIMSQYAGQEIAMHLQTRSSDGWYNYSITGSGLAVAATVSSGTALIDPEVSFLCQVLNIGGEDLGLEFVQQ